MFIRIESSSGLPITRQIVDQIRSHCAAGTLAPGDKVPSVRQLARELAVNQNTILHVYEKLTAEGILERRQGDGTYVTDRLPKNQVKAQRDHFDNEVDRLVHRAVDLNITAKETFRILKTAFRKIEKERP